MRDDRAPVSSYPKGVLWHVHEGKAERPFFYVSRWGQRILCEECGEGVTRPTMRWAIKAWNKKVMQLPCGSVKDARP